MAILRGVLAARLYFPEFISLRAEVSLGGYFSWGCALRLFLGKRDLFVERFDGRAEVDAVKNDRFSGAGGIEYPMARSVAAEAIDAETVWVDQHVFAQAFQLPVILELTPSVISGSGIGEYLDNQRGVALEVIGGAISRVAGHDHVRVEE